MDNQPVKFITILCSIEKALNEGQQSSGLGFLDILEEHLFVELRTQIASAFCVENMLKDKPFQGEYDANYEYGDISDAIEKATFGLYPKETTSIELELCVEERRKWGMAVINELDFSATLSRESI